MKESRFINLIDSFVALSLISLMIIFGIVFYYTDKIKTIKVNYENELSKEKNNNRLKIEMIKDRVKRMNDIIKQVYPYYAYSEKVNDAVNNIDSEEFNKKLDDLPIDLQRIYVKEYLLKVHGLDKYILKFPELGYPINPEKAFVPSFGAEFAQTRSYPQFYIPGKPYSYVHEGVDAIAIDTTEILATYDADVIKIYEWEGGRTVEIKYYNKVRKHWCIDRFLHCNLILVEVGDKVKKGQVIAQYGHTGRYTLNEFDHIHWSHLIWNGKVWIHNNVFLNSTWGNPVYNYVLNRF